MQEVGLVVEFCVKRLSARPPIVKQKVPVLRVSKPNALFQWLFPLRFCVSWIPQISNGFNPKRIALKRWHGHLW